MYCMLFTRPDISIAVGQIAEVCNARRKPQWKAVKRIMAYLKGTIDHGISFSAGPNNGILYAYSDADYAGDLDTRRSTTGYLLLLNNGPVTWPSRRQHCTTLSTTEDEYVAACKATKEVTWMRNPLEHIGLPRSAPKKPEFHRRTKHIDVQFHIIREKKLDRTIDINYIETEKQLADIVTKPLSKPRFQKLCSAIGVTGPPLTEITTKDN